jgi:two-component system, NarL family, nitrate/nitrite response regulator NarL
VTGQPVRIVIADDHPMFRDGLRRLLESEPGFEVVGEVARPAEAMAAIREHAPDVLLLDLLMPDGGGLAVLRALLATPVTTRVVLLTAAIEQHEQLAAVNLGVRGIIKKELATALLFRCIRAVMDGACWLGADTVPDLSAAVHRRPAERTSMGQQTLTPRELEVVAAILDGASNRDIAQQFGVSQQTVKNHLSSIFKKLGVSTRLELALYALNGNLLSHRPQLQ